MRDVPSIHEKAPRTRADRLSSLKQGQGATLSPAHLAMLALLAAGIVAAALQPRATAGIPAGSFGQHRSSPVAEDGLER